MLYLLSLPLQLVSTGALLKQGSTVLTIFTSIHLGVVVALFWALLANALVATQVVEDGTMSSLVVCVIIHSPMMIHPPRIQILMICLLPSSCPSCSCEAIHNWHDSILRRHYLHLTRHCVRVLSNVQVTSAIGVEEYHLVRSDVYMALLVSFNVYEPLMSALVTHSCGI